MSTTSHSSSSSRNATRRLIKELETWHNVESKDEKGIERLGPVNEGELLAWEAVINGRGVGAGYDGPSSTFYFLLLLACPFLRVDLELIRMGLDRRPLAPADNLTRELPPGAADDALRHARGAP